MKERILTGSKTLCPSAQPDWPDSNAIGVMSGTADEPRMSHLTVPKPVTDDLLSLSAPVSSSEVFRFAAPYINTGCVHFANAKCHLADRIGKVLPIVTERVPACSIRRHFRWWKQEGQAACLRCTQMVTDNYNPSPRKRQAAAPNSTLP